MKITSWLDSTTLYEDDCSTMKETLEKAASLGARLDGASLVNARLDGASLVNASLAGASLVNARLDGASLRTADLVRIKDDFFTVLDAAAAEVPALLAALRAGHINGSAYEGECSCLKGTIATARGVSYKTMEGPLAPNVNTPAETWFLAIRKNYKPDNSQVASITEEWILEWQAKQPLTPSPAAQ